MARRRRRLIIIDDMQWAHSSTLDLLRHIARHAREPILILGLHGTTDLAPHHQLRSVVADLEQADLATVMPIGGLDEDARSDLVRGMVDVRERDLAPQIAAWIASETGGNPFFFTEVLRSVWESDSIASILESDVASLWPRRWESPASSIESSTSTCSRWW
ncbi:MAG: putative ATPase [Candidatus Poriferisodalaceae bacterium]